MQFKLFSSVDTDGDVRKLEEMVDLWLATEQPVVRFVQQSVLDSHLIISFVYDGGQRHMAATAQRAVEVPEVFEQELNDAELDPVMNTSLPEVELPY